jgi:gamma-glutamyltranspeptidase/glutathione hydrolase
MYGQRMFRRTAPVLTLALSVAGPMRPQPAAAQRIDEGTVVRSAQGMVVTDNPLASRAGARVLAGGGNAVDAAVAAAFTLSVVEPTMSGLGGRTQILLRMADGSVVAIDGTTDVPAAYAGGPTGDEDAYGYATIAVPGTVAALDDALGTYGTWSLARVLGPAMAHATDGFALPAAEAARFAAAASRLAAFPGSRRHFLRTDGSVYREGDIFRQPALAVTLRTIAEQGADAFYRGELAATMARELAEAGALVTTADLANYRAEASPVVRGRYRDLELIGSYLPASGATTIEILQILDHFTFDVGSTNWAALFARALVAGFEDRARVLQPADAKAAWLTSPGLAAQRAAAIRSGSSPSGRQDTAQNGGRDEPENTTHVSVADRHGNVVALTQSVGPTMGSKVTSPALGFIWAATMGYLGELEPGTRRHWSSQSPLIVVRDNQPLLVLGAAGARRIISAVTQTVSRFVDGGLSLPDALAAPRLHPTSARVDVEARPGAGWSRARIDSLAALGFTIRPRADSPYFGRVNAIAFDTTTGQWIGAADPRWHGGAAAPAGSTGSAAPGVSRRVRWGY